MYEWQNHSEKASKFSTLRKYVELYSENDLFAKLSKVGLKIGVEILFYVLLLFYLLSDKRVDIKSKLIIMAALGYFILPADFIADFIPVLGFSDDAAFLSYALSSVSSVITPEVKQKAKEKLKSLFNEVIDDNLEAEIVSEKNKEDEQNNKM